MQPGTASEGAGAPVDGAAMMQEGEKVAAANDYQTALARFTSAAQADPKSYEAALNAGDAAYSLKDAKAAAAWFERAINIDPDRETAYRFWGDALLRVGGDPSGAKQKFIDAVVAEPYSLNAWKGLRQWAAMEDAQIAPPRIERPAAPEVDDKNPKSVNLQLDFGGADERRHPGASAWTMYSLIRGGYHGDAFRKDYPNETEYRHSLKEEDAALSMVATTVAKTLQEKKISPERLDESLRNLVNVNDAGMLDCWILINGADAGIERDYPAYRTEHRSLLHDYLELFVVHGGPN
jgi:tetratricopeptide (TPR) repeat protein